MRYPRRPSLSTRTVRRPRNCEKTEYFGVAQLPRTIRHIRGLGPSLLSQMEAGKLYCSATRSAVGKTHLLDKRQQDQNFITKTWAGGARRGENWLEVGFWQGASGFWVVPTVSQPQEPPGLDGGWDSASWVGIDGFDEGGLVSNDVLQAGVQQYVDANGVASYVPWFEWFAPAADNSPPYIFQTNILNSEDGQPFSVAPGQLVFVSVQYIFGGGLVVFGNETTGQFFSILLAPPPGATASGNSIEWIMEAPNGGEPGTSIPNFTPVAFIFARGWSRNPSAISDIFNDNPLIGDTINIATANGTILTNVTLGDWLVTIDFIG
jgi:Peptidase A4 family